MFFGIVIANVEFQGLDRAADVAQTLPSLKPHR